ncbi:hypothetical protein P879_02841 [Paragonimus westermani]|uniref:Uncharacterized protein n=1 Tax=Paragonimus westermani TaxID=34504 RepID=A0A8T0DRH7_9TREM|nr:hypothetical protein P879_02841 [Paragonimus westermani]
MPGNRKKKNNVGKSCPINSSKYHKILAYSYDNKLYNTPPTPPPEVLSKRERNFILDGVAVRQISDDYSRANPKVGQAIPVYRAQMDPGIARYFKTQNMQKLLRKTTQNSPATCIEGEIVARFAEHGASANYLRLRNVHGCGRSVEFAGGHGRYVGRLTTVLSYNGEFGYRRNTPWLRQKPSTFGMVTDLPLY